MLFGSGESPILGARLRCLRRAGRSLQTVLGLDLFASFVLGNCCLALDQLCHATSRLAACIFHGVSRMVGDGVMCCPPGPQ